MSKSATVFTRVDHVLKEQADIILTQLGISMSTAMGMFLQQLVLQRGLPFAVTLPPANPIAFNSLSDEEFDSLMNGALRSVAEGKAISFEEFDRDIRKELGI